MFSRVPAWWPRNAPATVALAIPVLAFLFNSYISQQERGFFDLSDIVAAFGFGILAWMAWRGVRTALYAGLLLCGVYLISTVIGGPPQFVAYWFAAIAAIAWTAWYGRVPAA